MEVIAIVMGETLMAGSAAVDAVGLQIGVDMARYWQADDAFFELIRDKEVLTRIVAEVAGETVAAANAGEKIEDDEEGRPPIISTAWAVAPRSSIGCRAGWRFRRPPTPRAVASARSRLTPWHEAAREIERDAKIEGIGDDEPVSGPPCPRHGVDCPGDCPPDTPAAPAAGNALPDADDDGEAMPLAA